MPSVKYQLIQEIEAIDDENLLKEVLILLKNLNSLKKYIHLSAEQKNEIEQARQELVKTKFEETEPLFKRLLNE